MGSVHYHAAVAIVILALLPTYVLPTLRLRLVWWKSEKIEMGEDILFMFFCLVK